MCVCVCVCMVEAEGDAIKCNEWVPGGSGSGLGETGNARPRSGSRVHGQDHDSLGHMRGNEDRRAYVTQQEGGR